MSMTTHLDIARNLVQAAEGSGIPIERISIYSNRDYGDVFLDPADESQAPELAALLHLGDHRDFGSIEAWYGHMHDVWISTHRGKDLGEEADQ